MYPVRQSHFRSQVMIEEDVCTCDDRSYDRCGWCRRRPVEVSSATGKAAGPRTSAAQPEGDYVYVRSEEWDATAAQLAKQALSIADLKATLNKGEAATHDADETEGLEALATQWLDWNWPNDSWAFMVPKLALLFAQVRRLKWVGPKAVVEVGNAPNFQLRINGFGCATFPDRGDYANEVARCVRLALESGPCASNATESLKTCAGDE